MLIQLDIAQTVGVAAVFLVIGELIKRNVPILERYFIPSPVIGGLVFSLITLYGHQTQSFSIEFYGTIQAFLLMAFFTTIGFSASFEMLKKGGVAVGIFLATAIGLVILQNVVGISLATLLGENPLLGLIAGSITLTGGHGTAAAFAPLLEERGVVGAMPAAIAAATWGLVAGCVIGGPVGSRLMKRYKIKGRPLEDVEHEAEAFLEEEQSPYQKAHPNKKPLLSIAVYAVVLLTVSMGLGAVIIEWLQDKGITLPAYLGAMIVAAVIRNVIDWKGFRFPEREFDTMGSISLAFFLVMALMSMKLWELAEVAGPLLLILVIQTGVLFLFAMFVTFRIMGKDYDAVVISTGHCGFGMGATPNAMANMQSFTAVNGPSRKAFFVIPLVGSLFIDFFNAVIITVFMTIFS